MATRYLPTPLGNAFFSDFNRESIHSALTNDVQGKTGYIIDRQSDSDLQAIMKSVYIRMAYDEYQDIRGQVGKMNAAVVSEASDDWCVTAAGLHEGHWVQPGPAGGPYEHKHIWREDSHQQPLRYVSFLSLEYAGTG